MQNATLWQLLYADDAVDHKMNQLQEVAVSRNGTYRSWGLTLSKLKTEVMHFIYPDPSKLMIISNMKHVYQFTYQGGVVMDDVTLPSHLGEIIKRITYSVATDKSLADRCWKRSRLFISTKVVGYKAIVLHSLPYGSETWATLASHVHKFEIVL